MLKKNLDELNGLPSSFVAGLSFKVADYSLLNIELLKKIHTDKNICMYVCFTEKYLQVDKKLKRAGIDTSNILFVDLISNSKDQKSKSGNCVFLGKADNFIDLTIVLHDFMSYKKKVDKCVYVDSVSAMMLHNSKEKVLEFLQYLSAKTKIWSARSVLLMIDEDMEADTVQEVEKVCDKLIRY